MCFLLLQKSSEWQQKFWEFLGCLFRLKRPPSRCPCPMLRRTRHPHRGKNNGVIPMPVDVEPSTRVGWYGGKVKKKVGKNLPTFSVK